MNINEYAFKPSRKIKIKTVRDLYLRWRLSKNKIEQRPDAVCAHGPLKDRSIYRQQVRMYEEAAAIIWEEYKLGVEKLTEAEADMLLTILKKEKHENDI